MLAVHYPSPDRCSSPSYFACPPEFKPPADFRPVRVTRKIPIPVNEHPELNFIGIIIGPRGNTHKRMEEESGARIAIRGRGSVKEGRKKEGHVDDGDDEDLHVLITGDTESAVNKAADMIE